MKDVSRAYRRLLAYLAIFAGVIGLWLLIGLAPTLFLCSWETRGTFGDMFGAANALFSALGTAGVIVALILQNRQMRHQIDDSHAMAAEVERQKTTQAAIADALARQAAALERAARLSAMTTLLTELERAEGQTRNAVSRSEISRRAEKLRAELRSFLSNGIKE